ncbi:MAG: hypothetical protein KF723_01195 [Rhizobiaceae bacterium]|nr:hypothetical protein [Rhizobiaceae bacterium]
MSWDINQVTFEAAKLLLQACGAMLVAWLAVRWALNRYKRERHWEHRLKAYTELLSAMGALYRIHGIWEEEELLQRKATGEDPDEIRRQYWQSRRSLDESIAVARFTLPPRIVEALVNLTKELSNARDHANSFFEQIEHEAVAVRTATDTIIPLGRSDLRI